MHSRNLAIDIAELDEPLPISQDVFLTPAKIDLAQSPHSCTNGHLTPGVKSDSDPDSDSTSSSSDADHSSSSYSSSALRSHHLEVDYQSFLARYPEYRLTSSLDNLRQTDFRRLTDAEETYVDHMGAALYPERLIRVHTELLARSLMGNTHSINNSSVPLL